MTTLWQDFRLAFRSLKKGWLVTTLAVVSLALAIAGNASVFSLINSLILRPMPYEEPDRLALIFELERELAQPSALVASAANFDDWRQRSRSFAELSAFRGAALSLGGEEPEQVTAGEVTPGFFALLRIRMARGRGFAEEEGRPGNERVVILSHQTWQRQLAGDPELVGREITLNGAGYTVVGILPEDFEFLGPGIQLWVPLALDSAALSRDQRDLLVTGRLAEGFTMERAKAELAAIGLELEKAYPEANKGYVVDAYNLQTEVPNTQSRQLFALLQGAVLFVMLIACANIANLLLARSQERRREITLRTILGAGSWRILRQLLTESVLLALAGGALGLALAYAGIRLMASSLAAAVPSYWTPVLDANVLAFTAAVTLLSGLLFGLAPALQSLKPELANVIKEGGRAGSSKRRRLVSKSLVVAEIALSLMLLGGGSVLIRSFLDLRNADPGFEMKRLLTAQLVVPAATYAEDHQVASLAERMLERLEGVPGVSRATLTNSLPQNVFNPTDTFAFDAHPPEPGEQQPQAIWLTTPPGYLETLGVPLHRGRFFTTGDHGSAPPVAVVNSAMAERYLGDEDPLGQRITIRGESRQIVGIAGDVRQTLIQQGAGAGATVYLPFAQEPQHTFSLMLRTGLEEDALSEAVRSEIAALDSRLSLGQVQSMRDFLDQFLVGVQVFNTVLIGFGFLALLLAALGTYGVLAYSVAQRSHEIGVRMAIGARQSQVVRMITWQGLKLALIGFALGAPGTWALTALIESLLAGGTFEVQRATAVGVGLILLAVSVLASVLPARRAAAVDPVVALRYE